MNQVYEYECKCGWKGEEHRFLVKPLDIQFKAKSGHFLAFASIKCPKCGCMLTVLMEFIKDAANGKNRISNYLPPED